MRIFIITSIFVIISINPAFSDTIHFKDGGKVEGVIKEKLEGEVIIDMGFGTMTIREDEIDRIEEATPEELKRLKKEKFAHEIETGEWAPDEYESISALYTKAKDDKTTLKDERRRHRAMRREISQKEKKVSKLLNLLDDKGQQLKSVDAKKSVKKYNEIIAEMNSLNADLNKENNKLKEIYKNEKELNAKLGKLASKYRGNFQSFRDTLEKSRESINKEKITADEQYFFETMGTKLSEMESDFKRDVALYTPQGNQIIVDTLINDGTLARLVVDTGASIVLISSDVAARLGIRYEDIDGDMEIIMADGTSAGAKPVVLKSVKVGDAEVKNVQAAILDRGIVGGTDGLLGMSFLNNFIMSVDSAGNKIIFEKVL